MIVKTWDPGAFYNYEEINRIGFNTQFLVDQLAIEGYNIVLSRPAPNESITDFPFVGLINNARRNILDVTAGFYYPPSTPIIVENPARKQIFDFNGANDLEIVLSGIYDLIIAMKDSYKYCGTFNCGEEGLL